MPDPLYEGMGAEQSQWSSRLTPHSSIVVTSRVHSSFGVLICLILSTLEVQRPVRLYFDRLV